VSQDAGGDGMRRKLNLAKGLWVGKVKVNNMITSNGRKKAERQAAENSRRKRYLTKFELDGIIAILPWMRSPEARLWAHHLRFFRF
ncbi:MAG: hypothetical protein KKG76_14195, partial [Euryarchaeota archaeon]|nr:hypothetical protein [Euryarchaeota archaeon]